MLTLSKLLDSPIKEIKLPLCTRQTEGEKQFDYFSRELESFIDKRTINYIKIIPVWDTVTFYFAVRNKMYRLSLYIHVPFSDNDSCNIGFNLGLIERDSFRKLETFTTLREELNILFS